jgi:hypothetical protein
LKTPSHFIEGGGWVAVACIGKKRARLFAFLAAAWTPVSAAATLPFYEGWPTSFGTLEWSCATLLAIHAVLVTFAITYWLREQSSPIISMRRDPEHDPWKLY